MHIYKYKWIIWDENPRVEAPQRKSICFSVPSPNMKTKQSLYIVQTLIVCQICSWYINSPLWKLSVHSNYFVAQKPFPFIRFHLSVQCLLFPKTLISFSKKEMSLLMPLPCFLFTVPDFKSLVLVYIKGFYPFKSG